MKKLAVLAVLVVAGLAAAVAPAASGGGKTYVPKDCTKPAIAPHRIIFACGDAGSYINRIHWNKFGKRHARGRGVLKERKTCTPPRCPAKGFHRYPAKIRLYRVRSQKCGGRHLKLYTRAALHFPGNKPRDAKSFKHTQLYCNP